MTKRSFRAFERRSVTLDCGDEMITKQSHKAECDINNILKQYQRTGIITHVQAARATYEDLPSDLDFQLSLNTLMEAEAAFAGLPAAVRRHFDNNPELLLKALGDPDQADKLREFGILKPVQAPLSGPAPTLAPTPPNPPTTSS